MSSRAISSVVGIVLLTFVAVLTATAVGTLVFGTATPERTPHVAIETSINATADRITLTHTGGETLHVETLRVRIRIDGQPLAYQPPVPFFATKGFESGPTGPFNTAADGRWTAGETAGVRLASTNSPQIQPGSTVEITVYSGNARILRRKIQA